MKTLIALFILFTAGLTGAGTTRHLTGLVRNVPGSPIANLTIHFYQKNGESFTHLTATTGVNGRWAIDLPPGVWRGAASTDDILSRGYFCGPGFVWCGDGPCGVDPGWPPLWGGGEIVWTPIEGDPGEVTLIIVPTRPDLSVEKPKTAQAGVKVTFETTTQQMTLIRQWRIEKSTDLLTWTPMQTVALSGTSPVIVPDPVASTAPACYYRAVQVANLVPPAP